jgi:L-ascorbate metabolism protein UlaG (beta-lactamase superfamily)
MRQTIQEACIVIGMELTKHTHATVVLEKEGASLVIDPGAYTPNSADLVAASTAVLITHDHPDHFDAGILDAAIAAQPELRVWAPASVVEALESSDRIVAVSAGDTFAAAGFDVTVFGEHHAIIHDDIPLMDNVGYLIDGTVYHPGDSYFVPGVAVETLLVPTSGPWAKLGEGVDFIRAITPARAIQIHDLMLSEVGRGSFAEFTGNLTGIPLETLELGTTVTV